MRSLWQELLGVVAALTAQVALVAPAHAEGPNLGSGVIETAVVHGPSLAGSLAGYSADRSVTIYLPPQYTREPNSHFPVIYALHGFGTSGADWPGFLKAPVAFDRAIAAGARPAIVVMPNAMSPLGGVMFSSSVTTGDWERFIAHDLVSWVDANYRTLPSRHARGLAGFSMGGYGALRIAMKHPDVFSAVYAMSSCCLAPQVSPAPTEGALEGFAALEAIKTPEEAAELGFGAAPLAMAAAWSPNPANPPLYFDLPTKDGIAQTDVIAAWSANAILAMVHQYVPSLRQLDSIAIDVGSQDFLLGDNRRLHDLLEVYGIRHSFDVYEGGHGDQVAKRFEEVVWPYFATALAGQ